VVTLSLVACEHRNYSKVAGNVAPEVSTLSLTVNNENFYDMKVYVVSGELGSRLGTVNGNSRGTFTVRRTMFPTGSVRFVAQPIGGFGRGMSDAMSVSPGQKVEFRIASNLALTNAIIRR
jgi:hypothetical protein